MDGRGRLGVAVAMVLLIVLNGGAGAGEVGPSEAQLERLVADYVHLHQHPELSYAEKESAAYVAGRLRELGYEVTTGVGRYSDPEKLSHGVVGVLVNGDGPTVLVRTDLDALPVVEETGLEYASTVRVVGGDGREVGVMHACGHDLHMTVFMGTAEQLAAHRDRWSGTVVMVGQPAEEVGAGSRALLEDGLYERFPKPDAALALHVSSFLEAGTVGVVPGYAFASVDSVDVTVRGVGGHGALPQTTVDPVVIAARIVVALQTLVSREISPVDPAVVTVGSIHGGSKHNIIPDEVALQLTVRSYKPEVREHLLAGIERIARGIALSAGVPEDRMPVVHVDRDEATPALYNDPPMTGKLEAVLVERLGRDHVTRVEPAAVGEDFARYTLEDHSVPSTMLWLGVVDPELMSRHRTDEAPLPPLHSSRFAPLPEPSIRTGVEAMTAAALALLGPTS